MRSGRLLVRDAGDEGSCDAQSTYCLGSATEAVAFWVYGGEVAGVSRVPQIEVTFGGYGVAEALAR